MPRFMFLQRGDCDNRPQMTPEEMQAGMEACMKWVETGMQAGWLLDPGSALSGTGAVVKSDLTVMDGPFAESKELVGGYSIVEAVDLEAAVEIVKNSPMPGMGSTIEVRELAYPGSQE